MIEVARLKDLNAADLFLGFRIGAVGRRDFAVFPVQGQRGLRRLKSYLGDKMSVGAQMVVVLKAVVERCVSLVLGHAFEFSGLKVSQTDVFHPFLLVSSSCSVSTLNLTRRHPDGPAFLPARRGISRGTPRRSGMTPSTSEDGIRNSNCTTTLFPLTHRLSSDRRSGDRKSTATPFLLAFLRGTFTAGRSTCFGSTYLSFPWSGPFLLSTGRSKLRTPKPPSASSPQPRASSASSFS